MTFDWKDGWLICFGFATLAVGVGWLRAEEIELSKVAVQGLAAALVLGPPALRRAVFGAPVLGARRDGAFYMVASVVGLLLMFFGLGAGALLAGRLSAPHEQRPDFVAEEMALLDAPNPLEGLMDGFEPLEESEEIVALRQAEERRHAEQEARRIAQEREREWEEREAEQRERTWILVTITLGLLGIGSLLLSLRYDKLSQGDGKVH